MEEKYKVHSFYILLILISIIVVLVVVKWTQIPNLVDYFNFALTLTSLVLALLAIIYAFFSNSSLSQMIGTLANLSHKISETSIDLTHATEELRKEVKSIPLGLKSVEVKLDETKSLVKEMTEQGVLVGPTLKDSIRSSDVPELKYPHDLDPLQDFPFSGLLLTDKPQNGDESPILYLAIYSKTNRYFRGNIPGVGEKWLYLEANMRPAFNLRIQVQVHSQSIEEIMRFLQGDGAGWELFGALPVIAERLYQPEDTFDLHAKDRFLLWREDNKRRMMISTFTATNAGISIHARLSDEAAEALALYLKGTIFKSGPTST